MGEKQFLKKLEKRYPELQKVYFAKYLPIKEYSNTWQWNNNIQNTGWELISPGDMDAIIAHGLNPAPEFRQVKLFLCSRDIQVGDNFKNIKFDTNHFSKVLELTETDVIFGDDGPTSIPRKDAYKVIGEISPEAIWVKEGDEFKSEDLEGILYCRKHPDESIHGYDVTEILQWMTLNPNPTKYKIVFEIKGPCGHFH